MANTEQGPKPAGHRTPSILEKAVLAGVITSIASLLSSLVTAIGATWLLSETIALNFGSVFAVIVSIAVGITVLFYIITALYRLEKEKRRLVATKLREEEKALFRNLATDISVLLKKETH